MKIEYNNFESISKNEYENFKTKTQHLLGKNICIDNIDYCLVCADSLIGEETKLYYPFVVLHSDSMIRIESFNFISKYLNGTL